MKTIAVITSTIGRPELIRAIESVRNQIYPCKHYIFVDGEQFHDKVRELVKDYPDLVVTYLPMNTGAGGWTNSFINAAASFLIKEDIVCYLDDDNWYDVEHTKALANAFNVHNVDMAFNLRRFCDNDGNYLCDDNTESLGFWTLKEGIDYQLRYKEKSLNMHVKFNRGNGHIDTNCLAFKKEVIRGISSFWTTGHHTNDHQLLQQFFKLSYTSMCTGVRTVNYIFNCKAYISVDNVLEFFEAPSDAEYELQVQTLVNINKRMDKTIKDWLYPTILRNNELYRL